jgi:hypothetical protein
VLDDAGGGAGFEQGLAQNREPPRELATHDRVHRVRLAQWPPRVLDPAAQVLRRELVLFIRYPALVGFSKEEANHRVGEDARHETIHDGAQHWFSTELVEERWGRSWPEALV